MSFFAGCRTCLARAAGPAPARRLGASSPAQIFDASRYASTSVRPSTSGVKPVNARPLVPKPNFGIGTPTEFLKAISRLPRRDLANDSVCTSAVGESWEDMFKLRGPDLKEKGVPIKTRRYILWALERFRQGEHPEQFAYQPKPKKIVRGWGPRVQKGIRVRGRKRPGEK